VLYINRSYADLSPEEVIGLPIGYFADPEYREVLNGELRKVIEGAESSGCEALSAGLTGPPRWFSVRFGPVRRDGQTVGATLIAQDITERKATEEALHNVQRRLMQVQEDERRRLAADLHDSVSQMLFALQMRLKRLRNRCDECARQEDLDEAIDQCNQLIRETRAVYRGLYPPGLVQLGLVSALRQLARDFEQTTEVNVTCCEIVENSRFDDDVEIALFRIAQEAVRNAVRHGHADNIGVDLEMNGDALTLTVADDGGGFDVRQPNTGSLGLRTMQERAVSIGGTFSLESSPTGTTLEVSVPATPRPAVPGQ
jgi:two-component system NarL family sensor kinase